MMSDRMEKKFETKRQHYVPRLLLRRFSPDGRSVSLMVLKTGQRIGGASIKSQCCEDYFYGDDGVMEKSFADEESKIGAILGDLSPGHLEGLEFSQLEDLRNFAHYLRSRTLGAAEAMNSFFEVMTKAALEPMVEQDEQFDTKDLDLVRIRLTSAQNEALWHAATMTPLLRDLEVKFLLNERSPGFVISDNPVVFYNQYAEHHSKFGRFPAITGLAVKGLQMFVPLSARMTLAVFDPSAYRYGGHRRVVRAGPDDVQYLNEMQAANAFECIYFDPDVADDVELERLRETRSKHRRVHDALIEKSRLRRLGEDKMSQFIFVNNPDVRVGAKLSLIRLMDHQRYEHYQGIVVPERSPELVEFSHRYREHLESIVEQRRAASEAAADPSSSNQDPDS